MQCTAAGVLLSLFGAVACGGEAASGKPGVGNGVNAQLESHDDYSLGQQAQLPASGVVTQSIVAPRGQTFRSNSEVYVSYSVEGEGSFLYLSFAPDLAASFTTAEARAAFKDAYIQYDLAQPEAVGGRVALLSSRDLLALSDFERFEVSGSVVSWRLVRTNPGRYSKRLSIADLDPRVDPSLCTTGDISGDCWCEFSGPPTTVTLDGTFPI